jgi:hypothetical protein
MNHQSQHQGSRRQKWVFWGIGLGSLAWLALRSGTKPRRLAYPCQRAALANSVGFLGYLASVLGLGHFYHRLKRKATLSRATFFGLALTLVALLTASNLPVTPVFADLDLPAWTSPTAISDVFAVSGVPVPECSLDGGTLPATPPCNIAAYALHDAGVDSLITEMETQGTYFYQTTAHPDGIVGANDVVVIKINNQWAYNGTPQGRLCTNNDTLKGVIWRILQHPDTFSGEIVVAENTQGVVWDWDATPANAQDPNQSYQDVILTFQGLGYPVSLYRWDDLNSNLISGGDVNGAGYPTGEYASGDASDAYILLEDTEGAATNELSYPKFQTTDGISVSMRYGVWNGATYDADRLTLINMPVLKQHGMAGATIAWKNFIGFLTIENNLTRFGEAGDEEWQAWEKMHGFFWGYQELGDTDYGLLGRQMAYIRTPDLNVVDAIWIADDNYQGTATRQNILLASTDPFAVDWYASEYVLYAFYANQDASAARAGVFRNATRTNQNAAAAKWPGTYPYIDLLDAYDGNTPSDTEKNQMNVYVVGGGTTCEGITDVGITGVPEIGYTDIPYTFTGVVTPTMASTPITYTWMPGPDSGQGMASATYIWATPGIQTVSLLAENCGGSATITRTVTIEEIPDCAYPLETASIAGPTSGYTGTTYIFTTAYTPANATAPITYTWAPMPGSGQGTASVGYTWDVTGTHIIDLTVENCGGSAAPTYEITITARPIPSHFIYLPAVLRAFTDTTTFSGSR